jgi:hypothetical protein
MAAPPRPPTRRLLSVSRDTPLLIGRNDMLAIAGYSVSSPREPLDAILLLQHDEYLAVLIGHSVLPDEAAAIAGKAKALQLPVIFVYRGEVQRPKWADLSVDNDRDIPILLDFLTRQGNRIAS